MEKQRHGHRTDVEGGTDEVAKEQATSKTKRKRAASSFIGLLVDCDDRSECPRWLQLVQQAGQVNAAVVKGYLYWFPTSKILTYGNASHVVA